MRRFLGAFVALTLVAGAALVAEATDRTSDKGRTVGEKVDDAAITGKVKAKLATQRARNLVAVDVDTRDGVVHLQGTVPTAADKAEAGRLARDTEGVVSVRNSLTVASATGATSSASPADRTGDTTGRTVGEKVDDAAITGKVKAKLATQRAKNLVSVNVDTKDGVVHLQGTVPTQADKVEAERLARDTEGVRRVMNDLTVSSTTSTPSASPSSR